MKDAENHSWEYCSVGGVVRVKIGSGKDIEHLGELDQKLWTALSCPVDGLNFDACTLALLDEDKDGKIRVGEVVKAAQWLCSVVKDSDTILSGEDFIRLDNISTGTPEGKLLHDSARQILRNLGKEEQETISIADSSDSVAIFARTAFNGDGVITAVTAGDDEELKSTIAAIASTISSTPDRSGEAGITAEAIEKFYAALADYDAWQTAAEASRELVFPFGDDTAAAFAACEALKDKIADYFMRCKLIAFTSDSAAAVDVPVDKIAAISGENLASQSEQIASYPLARPSAEALLPLDGINPAWQDAFGKFKALVLGDGGKPIDEAQWNAILAKFAPYIAWKESAKGTEAEALGLDEIRKILKADRKAELLELVEKDKAVAGEASAIDEVDKLLHLYRDFYRFLENYVIFGDFYRRDPARKAMFEAGELYIDQRCCDLCIKVADMGKHADMAALSGMFLIYCTCVSKSSNRTMDIVAVMTDGGIKNLRPGKNAVFYDRDGLDWDATVTKIVDNPISIKAAFWSPYRKFWDFCVGIINKSAAEKESKVTADLQQQANNTVAAPGGEKKQAFDIAKFSGIFAALGMGLGMLASAITDIFKGIGDMGIGNLILAILALIIVISGPSCFIAWTKLRKRNLGPVLNANGWAINSVVLVNTLFGEKLTKMAKYPVLSLDDPFAPRIPLWKKILRSTITLLVILAGVFAALYFTDNLKFLGIERNKPEEELVTEAPAEEVSAEEAVPEAAPEAAAE